ncbi:MAG: FlgD immunoglobulin-like domain containing protein [Bacteroidota bacterium]
MKRLGLLFLVAFTVSTFDLIAQTWAPAETSHFGVDGFETANFFQLTPQQLDAEYQWEASGIRNMNMAWNRTLSPAGGQFRWNDIEAVQGTYDWSKPDAFVKRVQAQGLQLLVLVHPFAQWDQPTKRDMDYDKPNNMTAFKRFIAKLVERYDADGVNDMPGLLYPIKYFEIGNEPEGQTFGDSPGKYNDFMNTVKAAYDTAKVVYPNVKIVVGGATPIYEPRGFLNVVDTFWKGALNRSNVSNYFDVFNFHFFVGQYTQDISVFIDYWKQLLTTYGLTGKEIWITETGNYSGTCTGSDNQQWPNQSSSYQAGWWLKHASYALANGVSKLFWVFYYSDQTDWRSHVAFIDIDKTTKKAAYFSHKLMAEKIDAFTSVIQNSYSETSQYQTSGTFKFSVAGKPVYLLWNDANGNVTLTGLTTGTVRTTKGVPKLNGDGSVALDNSGNPTFDTASVAVTNGQATISLTSVPVYVEEVATVQNKPDKPMLVYPSNGQNNLPAQLNLKWHKTNYADSYRCELASDAAFNQVLASDSALTDTVRQITLVNHGKKYYWRIRAKNNAGTSQFSDVWNFITIIPQPNQLAAVLSNPKEVKLTWSDNSNGEFGFIIERKKNNDNYAVIDSALSNETSYVDKNVTQGFTYVYKIKAYTDAAESAYSNEASVTVTDVREIELPREFSLGQNYPNPFNPTTTISYTIPSVETAHVSSQQYVVLKVYDLLGREVATLVNEEKAPGNYEVTFDGETRRGESLPSGVYFYRFSVGFFSDIKKMVVIK